MFFCTNDSQDYDTLHSNCPWYTLQAHTLTRYHTFHAPLTISTFHAPLTISEFYIENNTKVCLSVLMVARIMKSCIVIILTCTFFPLHFTLQWLRSFVIILPNAGAISTSAEFLYKNILWDHCLHDSGLCILKILTIREMVNFQKLDIFCYFQLRA